MKFQNQNKTPKESRKDMTEMETLNHKIKLASRVIINKCLVIFSLKRDVDCKLG